MMANSLLRCRRITSHGGGQRRNAPAPLCYNPAIIAAILSRPIPDAQPGTEPANDYSPSHHNHNPAARQGRQGQCSVAFAAPA